MTDDLPFDYPSTANPGTPAPRKCRRHTWAAYTDDGIAIQFRCSRCSTTRNAERARRGRNNRARGNRDELAVARLLGGEKVGPLGLPWDVTIPGYLRVQCKRLDRWPSIATVLGWLDAIPAGHELRGVSLADTPGPGGRTRRLLVVDLEEYARWHGRENA